MSWITVREAAAITGLSVYWLQRQIHEGKLPAYDICNGSRIIYRIDRDDLERWMEKRQVGA